MFCKCGNEQTNSFGSLIIRAVITSAFKNLELITVLRYKSSITKGIIMNKILGTLLAATLSVSTFAAFAASTDAMAEKSTNTDISDAPKPMNHTHKHHHSHHGAHHHKMMNHDDSMTTSSDKQSTTDNDTKENSMNKKPM